MGQNLGVIKSKHGRASKIIPPSLLQSWLIGCTTGWSEPLSVVSTTAENNPPNIPSDPNPADGATDVGLKTQLSWTGGDPDPGDKAVYDLYFGTTTEPGLVTTNLPMPNFYPGILKQHPVLLEGVARDTSQAETSGPIWTFTTNDCDCDPQRNPKDKIR